jgi:hypothetical protein
MVQSGATGIFEPWGIALALLLKMEISNTNNG